MKLSSNIPIFLRNGLYSFLVTTLVADESVTRNRALDTLKTIVDTGVKKPDIKASLRENSMIFPENKIFVFLIQTLESKRGSFGQDFDDALLSLLKMISTERSLRDFQDIFLDIQNVEGFIKSIGEKSINLELRRLFAVLYENMNRNWSNDQIT